MAWDLYRHHRARLVAFAARLAQSQADAEDAVQDADQAPGVADGVPWRATAWVRCPVARPVIASIRWYDTAGNLVGTSAAAAVTLTANT